MDRQQYLPLGRDVLVDTEGRNADVVQRARLVLMATAPEPGCTAILRGALPTAMVAVHAL
jgi:hypothetical protein